MFFDYFYEHEAEQFAFYMIPKEIVEDKPFCELSDGSKLLYSIILDRVKLSRKNGWIDDKNRVYIIFTVEEVQNTMRCAKQKATKLMQELETIGLIEKKRQGLGKPNLLYVKNFVRKGRKSKFQKNENHTSGSMESENPEVPESYGINTDQINPDFINTDSFFPSAPKEIGQTDGMMDRERIRKQIEYDCLRQRYRSEQLDELVEIMLEVMMNRSPTIKIGRDAEYPTSYVQERFARINALHIERVMDGIADNRTQVYNIRAYLLATLFNSVSTLDNYSTMQYNHDFGSSWWAAFFMPGIREKGKEMKKRPLAYITAHWSDNEYENTERAAKFCRAVYDAGFSPICPLLIHSLFLRDEVPQEHKDGLDMARDYLRRSNVLVVCGSSVDEAVKNDIAMAERLRITATTLDGILTVKGQGRRDK